MYAVIRAGGKQYRVQENDTVIIEKMDGNEGDAVTLGEDGFTYIKVKNHQRHYGHRQHQTTVRIDKIEA
jgi:ribosomal protein L21